MLLFVDKYFWVLGILWALLNYQIRRSDDKELVTLKPELEDNLKKLAVGFLAFYALPWVVMGIGILSGGAQLASDYLKPCSGNIYIIAFYATLFFLVCGVGIWIWFAGGADFLVRHSAEDGGTSLGVKLRYAGGVLILTLMFMFACKLGVASAA